MSTTSAPAATRSPQRTYPAYAHGLARRVLLTREMAVVAGLLVVYVWSWFNVAYFDQSITMFNLLRDNAAILMIALPMALIITTGEIDLSVSSTLAVSAAVTGVLVKDAGLSVPIAAVLAILVGCSARRPQRRAGRLRRTAVARGHHRHARALPRSWSRGSSRPSRSATSPPSGRTSPAPTSVTARCRSW